jgi:hypothetical protein
LCRKTAGGVHTKLSGHLSDRRRPVIFSREASHEVKSFARFSRANRDANWWVCLICHRASPIAAHRYTCIGSNESATDGDSSNRTANGDEGATHRDHAAAADSQVRNADQE